MKNKVFILAFLLIVGVFFRQFFLYTKLPIPADTIIGLYHPFRDLYTMSYPRGIPYKNSLITDPVRQQYPWRNLAINLEKNLNLPLWNPYNSGGTPLLANFQTGAFYPLNVLFFLFPFDFAWSILVISQMVLAGVFLYLYLTYFKTNKYASFLGSITFAFSGFSIAWLEWNTILQTALWLPLILLAKEHLLKKISIRWILVLVFSECCAIFAGHLQVYFYVFLISNLYLFTRIIQIYSKKYSGKEFMAISLRSLLPFLYIGAIIFVLTMIQLLPTTQFILLSARDVDQASWTQPGWFIPWQNLIQFIAPDFFGNPTTLNYWGVWNYGEFIGYIGIVPLVFSLHAIFFRRDRKTIFFTLMCIASLVFSLPTFFATIPYFLKIPFISTSQPTRLLFITDFSLSILSALGFDLFLKRKKDIFYSLILIGLVFVGLWLFILVPFLHKIVSSEDLLIAKRNLFFPSAIFALCCISVLLIKINNRKIIGNVLLIVLLAIVGFDLLRFAEKFTPFTNREYLFPKTAILSFLQKNVGSYRIMTTDSRILPPNFSVMYKIQSIDGYDPLYLKRYGELIAASERGKPDISSPFGFNRIITPHNYDSRIVDLLGVKYILSLSDVSSPKLKKVFQEGETRVYENIEVLPRAFFVKKINEIRYSNKETAMQTLFNKDIDLFDTAIVEFELPKSMVIKREVFPKYSIGEAHIISYSENNVTIKTNNNGEGFLVFTDSYYPSWHAKIDSVNTGIYRTDYNLRGIFVPKGNHVVKFYNSLL